MTTWERRPALDGLRAVALGMVLLFHGGVGFIGGAIGVDVFLVLSGYLITGLLLVELDATGGIGLRSFWARRARRLVPAAVAAVAVLAVLLRPDGLDVAAALGWWSNWRFALAEEGYFAGFDGPSPLRHMWSLAVEEQWYLVWPPLLLVLARAGRRPALAATVALALASAAAMWAVAGDLDRAHMGTDTRAQGLLVGAALALALHRQAPAAFPPAVTTAAGVAGGTILLAVAWRVPGTEPWLYRGGHLLVAIASAAVVVAALRPTGAVTAVLSLRPLRAVGRVSYGAYLWHWPLFVWLTPDRTGLDPWPLLAVRCTATAAATVLSWHLVERPFLEGRALPRPSRVAPAAALTAMAVVVAGVALDPTAQPRASSSIAATAAATPRLPEGVTAAALRSSVAAAPRPSVLDRALEPAVRGGDPVVTVVGDSSAWALAWDVEPVPGLDIEDGGMLGCGVSPAAVLIAGRPHVEPGHPVPCAQAVELWASWASTTDPDLVVVALGAWEVYDRVVDGRALDVGTGAWARWLAGEVEAALAALAEAAPRAAIAVAEVPCFEERSLALGGPASPRNDGRRVAAVNAVLRGVVDDHPARLTWLPWARWLCGPGAYERPDGVHLHPPSARELWAGPLGEWVRTRLGAG